MVALNVKAQSPKKIFNWSNTKKNMKKYRIKESIKNHKNKIQELAKKSIVDTNAYQEYRKIDENYQMLVSTQF